MPPSPRVALRVDRDVRQLITACLLSEGSEGDAIIAEHVVRRVVLDHPRCETIAELTGMVVGLLRVIAAERGESPATTWQRHCLATATLEREREGGQ